MDKISTVDEYIAQFPADVQSKLTEMRKIIKQAAPTATETISWGMPTYKLTKNLVHFANAKNHIGLYPGDKCVQHFLPLLTAYKTSKGAIQFPKSQPLSVDLIRDITLYCVKENAR